MTKLIEQFNRDVEHEQLLLSGDAFAAIATMADGGVITPTSLDLTDPEMPYEDYERLGMYLGRMNRSCQWWIGDWLVFGEGAYGEKYAQAAFHTGLSESTLLNRASICRNIPREVRLPNVPFSTHAEVAGLPPREQRRWLKKAEQGNWTREELRAAMKSTRTDSPPPSLPEADAVQLEEVARAILRDLQQTDDPGFYKIPAEDVVRLRAALGEEPEA
jgi:hypothetical protein